MQQSGEELPLSVAPGTGNHTRERERRGGGGGRKAVIETRKHKTEADRLKERERDSVCE